MNKKRSLVTLILAADLLFTAQVQAENAIISCDPNATGSIMYPNVACNSSGQLQVVTTGGNAPTSAALVDHSGTIAVGGTSQTLSAAKSRHYFFVQNLSTTNLYINFTSAASAGSGSILLLPNASFVQEGSLVSSELITIFGATTGQAFTAKDN